MTSLKELSQYVEMNVVRDAKIKSAGFLDATYGDCNFVFIRDKKSIEQIIANRNISAVFADEVSSKIIFEKSNKGIVVSSNPEKMFFQLHNMMAQNEMYNKDVCNKIDESAQIDSSVSIASKNVIIGKNVTIEPNVTILERVSIGDNCYIGAGTVLGARTFKYYRDEDTTIHMNEVGWVKIGNNVEIISNCCVEPGIIDNTIIGDNTIINSLVNIGHGVKIGKGVQVSTGAAIAGSTIVEDQVWIGLNAVIKQKIHIKKKAYICMGSVVSKDIEEKQKVSGNFAIDHAKNIAHVKEISRLI